MNSEEQLRKEIIESQKARNDLLKWKLIAVGAIGSIGIGLTDSQIASVPLVLCVIPFVCVYIDLHCSQLWLQIHAIGAYLRKKENNNYERWAQKVEEKGVFVFEKWILYWTTAILSGAVFAYGFVPCATSFAYFVSGFLGIVLSGVAYCLYKKKKHNLEKIDCDSNLTTPSS